MELEQRWDKLRDLVESIDKLKEERREFTESIKAVEGEISAIITDGGEAKAWDELQERWNRLNILRNHRRTATKEIAELKQRAGVVIEKGSDPADDGQTSMELGSPPTPDVPPRGRRK